MKSRTVLTLSATAALFGTTSLAQTGYPPEIQGQVDRLLNNGFTVTEIYRDDDYVEIDAVGPDGLRYELELDDNRWEMRLSGDDEEDDEEDDEDDFDDEDFDDEEDDEDEDDEDDEEDDDEDDDEDEDEDDDDDDDDDDEDDDEDDE